MNNNRLRPDTSKTILFVDMNSFFASCEQQVNFYLRGRPVGVCVYTGENGCIISPSGEAKLRGVKTGMRLREAMALCPDLVPLETNPNRYRDFHIKIMNVLKYYSEDVIPKSIDEAIVDISDYMLIHKDAERVAKGIKIQIRKEVGDFLKCSIGIAPNAFLAKLGSSIKKPDGLTVINPENIDDVLKKISLLQLPGIGKNMAERLLRAGINTPLEMRHSDPERLRAACKSIVGVYWHYRLNFSEVDLINNDYKSMQAMRQISVSQRESTEFIKELLLSLCMTLEKRMVKQNVFCSEIFFNVSYEEGESWNQKFKIQSPLQDGAEMLKHIQTRITAYEKINKANPVINSRITAIGVGAANFMDSDLIQYHLFENNIRKDKLRKTVYDLKSKFGEDKILKAAQLTDEIVYKDAIGFGSVKDIYERMDFKK
ncbi:MAG: DNA polymerase IV [Cytophagaceae bacterium]|nr:DNA polymerase IV [Cytophagaceae bacterium]